MNIRFLNLTKLLEECRAEIWSDLEKVIGGAHFIGGESLTAFERNFAAWLGEGFTTSGCGNGTDAICIAAKALGLEPGSEAIIPAMTFIATAEGLIAAGLKVRLVDVEQGTWLIDVNQLEAAISANTRLLVPVHLYGQMAPMDTIREIADRRGCKVLEDAAQAHGAKWKGKSPGHWGDVATFSFFPGKNLGAFGDGGAVASRNPDLIRTCYAMGKHGGERKYEHIMPGMNSRLDGIQAAVLDVKLRYLDRWNQSRKDVAGWYRELLGDVKQVVLPTESPSAAHVYHLFVVLAERRDELAVFLNGKGIETGVHYPKAIHQLPVFKNADFARGSFPRAERLAREGLSLPMCPTLKSAEVEYVATAVKEFYRR